MVINTQKNTHDQRLVMTLLIKYPLWAVYQLVVMTQLINFVGACNDHHILFFTRNTCLDHGESNEPYKRFPKPREVSQKTKSNISHRAMMSVNWSLASICILGVKL